MKLFLKNQGKSCKTISLGEGLRYDLSCTPRAFKFMPNSLVGPSECETKFALKHFGMGYVKMYGFHGNPLYDSRDWRVGLQIQSYLVSYLSWSTKIGVKLKLRHMPFFLWSDL